MQVCRPELCVSSQVVPVLVPAHKRHAGYVKTLLKKLGNTLVAQVVEMQVWHTQRIAGLPEILAQCLLVDREDAPAPV